MPPRTRTPSPPQTETRAPDGEQPEPDHGGWFRNTGATSLTVLGDGVTAVLAPGRIAALNRTPTHRDLTPATEADFLAQQAADTASEASTDETEA
ncbi:hypothetical protein [Actinocrinis sp.]|uniref:hypothetical protein n=1 Tax=Actinocrinis sp. TaxID=1920516 RepID=UPI002D36E787|nr:hypothetical protein [Actinocrinis sp.]HZP55036.1 hypothetical protein [Actinocrinis sp.]